MVSQYPLPSLLILALIYLLHSKPTKSDDNNLAMPVFAFSWLGNNDTFMAGDTATIKVIVIGNYESGKYGFPFRPNITVNNRVGNSSFISGVFLGFDGGTENWRICFTPIKIGLFNVLISDDHFRVLDSSMHFHVTPGRMYPAAGIFSLLDGVNEITAGTVSQVLILPKDAFGNNVTSSSEGPMMHNFTLFALTSHGFPANVLNVTNKGWNQQGYLGIEFVATTAGSLLLYVQVENQTIEGSPLSFTVNPGKLDVCRCIAQWNVKTTYFQLFSKMEASIHQYDHYGNLVPGLYAFDIEVIEKGTNLSMPIADLDFQYIEAGIQSFSFSLQEAGNFTLMISDKEHESHIFNTPYDFTVYIGYCNGVNSIVNGSGLNNSIAGETAKFSVFLKDDYLYPSPVELEILQVHIINVYDSQILQPNIQIRENPNAAADNLTSGRLIHGDVDFAKILDGPMNDFPGKRSSKASAFDIIYVPENCGIYEILVFCGNIQLNGGNPYKKEVSPAGVNVSLSGLMKFSQKVPKLVKNEVIVQLKDSYYNLVTVQQSKLKLEIASTNKSSISTWIFVDNNDGTYTASYLAMDVGTYELCVSYDGVPFMPCPFRVNAYNSEYFPKAYDDTISLWEDESILFDVMENDYFAGGNASIIEYFKPSHGSLLQYGNKFRYTLYKHFHGNDSFSYTIVDVNGNLASGSVYLLILCKPPQLFSIPNDLQATEDVVSPSFGGFPGFEVIYSDLDEDITVTLRSQHGYVLLSPMPVQFSQPRWSKLSVHRETGKTDELVLIGCLNAVNFALQSIKYLGQENFYGVDMIKVSTTNKNGQNAFDVPIYVQPINDPPLINIPSVVILEEMSNGVLIFGSWKSEFDFVSDPDLLNFHGNRSHFLLLFSLEVSSGFLSTKLPAELIRSTELKLKYSYLWQPLQTFVTISKHFLVKAKAIRFRGTIDNCNAIMKQLSYHEGKHGAVLTVTVNDLGNHGCYPNCAKMKTTSLFAESTVIMMRKKPMSSLAAHTLGSAVVIESIAVLSLGVIFLFFTCKCAVVLVQDDKRSEPQNTTPSEIQDSSSKPTMAEADAYGNEQLLMDKSSKSISDEAQLLNLDPPASGIR